jgi:DNA-binding MarR family transcriptional regulator
MGESVEERQHVVKSPTRPARTAAGDAFTELVVEVAWLGGIFSAVGEALARVGGQTLARWVILDALEDGPATVAQLARRRGIARQAVQRVADQLARDGLVAYAPNPRHRRAQLLEPTPRGREALRAISAAQKAWADALGAEIGEAELRKVTPRIGAIRRAVSARATPGVPGGRRRERQPPPWSRGGVRRGAGTRRPPRG